MAEVKEMIAFCGIICTECDTYLATQADDDEKRAELARRTFEEFGMEVKLEDMNCDGCLAEGRHIGYCDTCEIRACGIERDVVNCAHCENYEGCVKLAKFFEMAPSVKAQLEAIRTSLQA
jgi:hypothetical protein